MCYNAFAANLNAGLPPGKRIPPEVAVVMSEPETQQAIAHVDKVYGRVLSKAQADAEAVMARHAAWQSATTASVEEQNQLIEARAQQTKIDLDLAARAKEDLRFSVPPKAFVPSPGGKK